MDNRDRNYYEDLIKEHQKSLTVTVESINNLEQQNADLVAALEKIANPPISPPSDKADRSVEIAEQALAKVKEK